MDIDQRLEHSEADEPEVEMAFRSLPEFVEHLATMYRRPVGTGNGMGRWCPEWWKHPEAISRLESLWRAYENLRQGAGTEMSSYWRDHVDHHMRVLLSSDGPFKFCSADEGHDPTRPKKLPLSPPPTGLFDPM